MALPLLTADGRCSLCNGEVTTGGCPRCTSTVFDIRAYYQYTNLDMRPCKTCGYRAYQHAVAGMVMICPTFTTFEPMESP